MHFTSNRVVFMRTLTFSSLWRNKMSVWVTSRMSPDVLESVIEFSVTWIMINYWSIIQHACQIEYIYGTTWCSLNSGYTIGSKWTTQLFFFYAVLLIPLSIQLFGWSNLLLNYSFPVDRPGRRGGQRVLRWELSQEEKQHRHTHTTLSDTHMHVCTSYNDTERHTNT